MAHSGPPPITDRTVARLDWLFGALAAYLNIAVVWLLLEARLPPGPAMRWTFDQQLWGFAAFGYVAVMAWIGGGCLAEVLKEDRVLHHSREIKEGLVVGACFIAGATTGAAVAGPVGFVVGWVCGTALGGYLASEHVSSEGGSR